MAGGYLLLAAASQASAFRRHRDDTGKAADKRGGVLCARLRPVRFGRVPVVSALAALNAFLPNLLWALGYASFPKDATTEWAHPVS